MKKINAHFQTKISHRLIFMQRPGGASEDFTNGSLAPSGELAEKRMANPAVIDIMDQLQSHKSKIDKHRDDNNIPGVDGWYSNDAEEMMNEIIDSASDSDLEFKAAIAEAYINLQILEKTELFDDQVYITVDEDLRNSIAFVNPNLGSNSAGQAITAVQARDIPIHNKRVGKDLPTRFPRSNPKKLNIQEKVNINFNGLVAKNNQGDTFYGYNNAKGKVEWLPISMLHGSRFNKLKHGAKKKIKNFFGAEGTESDWGERVNFLTVVKPNMTAQEQQDAEVQLGTSYTKLQRILVDDQGENAPVSLLLQKKIQNEIKKFNPNLRYSMEFKSSGKSAQITQDPTEQVPIRSAPWDPSSRPLMAKKGDKIILTGPILTINGSTWRQASINGGSTTFIKFSDERNRFWETVEDFTQSIWATDLPDKKLAYVPDEEGYLSLVFNDAVRANVIEEGLDLNFSTFSLINSAEDRKQLLERQQNALTNPNYQKVQDIFGNGGLSGSQRLSQMASIKEIGNTTTAKDIIKAIQGNLTGFSEGASDSSKRIDGIPGSGTMKAINDQGYDYSSHIPADPSYTQTNIQLEGHEVLATGSRAQAITAMFRDSNFNSGNSHPKIAELFPQITKYNHRTRGGKEIDGAFVKPFLRELGITSQDAWLNKTCIDKVKGFSDDKITAAAQKVIDDNQKLQD